MWENFYKILKIRRLCLSVKLRVNFCLSNYKNRAVFIRHYYRRQGLGSELKVPQNSQNSHCVGTRRALSARGKHLKIGNFSIFGQRMRCPYIEASFKSE